MNEKIEFSIAQMFTDERFRDYLCLWDSGVTAIALYYSERCQFLSMHPLGRHKYQTQHTILSAEASHLGKNKFFENTILFYESTGNTHKLHLLHRSCELLLFILYNIVRLKSLNIYNPLPKMSLWRCYRHVFNKQNLILDQTLNIFEPYVG